MDKKFEAGKTYRLSFPNGSYLLFSLCGGEPLSFTVKGGEIIGVELFNSPNKVEEVEDTLGE